MARYKTIEEYNIQCKIARAKSYERSKKRNEIYKNSKLPYSFTYKIRKSFVGKNCPICNVPMGIYIKDDDDPIICETPAPTIQHNIPLAKGGKHEINNISVICRRCNSKIKDNITSDLNNSEVVEIWQKMIAKDFIG